MKRKILIVYAIIVTTVTVLFMIFGEWKDPRYYVIMLILAIIGRLLDFYGI